jgi:uncharacterized protein YfaS (alpha-2-macroglobulin family)
MQALPMGNYLLIAQNTFDSEKEEYTNSLNQFRVTALAVVSRGLSEDSTQYVVSNSLSGKRLKNAAVLEKNERYDKGKSITYNGPSIKTDENGVVISKKNPNARKVQVSYKGDTLMINASNRYYYYGEESEKEQVILFTDRPIYRPGQTLFYKGLFIKKQDTKNSIVAGEQLKVTFNDANGEELEEVSVTTNEYGTFQGSFSIPMGKMNGSMALSTIYGSIAVQVEEYKRPTFEVLFDKSTQKYKLNDSVSVKGKATTFSGYAVGAGK